MIIQPFLVSEQIDKITEEIKDLKKKKKPPQKMIKS